jgi:hypothetical protein
MIDEEINAYIRKIASEKESLTAKYLELTGLRPDEIVLVEKRGASGEIVFYPAPKKDFAHGDETRNQIQE